MKSELLEIKNLQWMKTKLKLPNFSSRILRAEDDCRNNFFAEIRKEDDCYFKLIKLYARVKKDILFFTFRKHKKEITL